MRSLAFTWAKSADEATFSLRPQSQTAAVVPAVIEKLIGAVEDDGPAQDFEKKFTKLAGEDNLLGSAGEFGWLFAFLANKPGAREIDGESTVSVEDLESMFGNKRLPEGSDIGKKTASDWVMNTIHWAICAAKEYELLHLILPRTAPIIQKTEAIDNVL